MKQFAAGHVRYFPCDKSIPDKPAGWIPKEIVGVRDEGGGANTHLSEPILRSGVKHAGTCIEEKGARGGGRAIQRMAYVGDNGLAQSFHVYVGGRGWAENLFAQHCGERWVQALNSGMSCEPR